MKIFFLCFLFFVFSEAKDPNATLRVEFTNVKNKKGKLWIALYKPNDKFGAEKPNIFKIIAVEADKNPIAMFELDPGKYALAVYQDLNGNEKLDKNFLGIPKEPYGFSKDFRPRFSAPSFADCAFELPSAGQQILVELTN